MRFNGISQRFLEGMEVNKDVREKDSRPCWEIRTSGLGDIRTRVVLIVWPAACTPLASTEVTAMRRVAGRGWGLAPCWPSRGRVLAKAVAGAGDSGCLGRCRQHDRQRLTPEVSGKEGSRKVARKWMDMEDVDIF